LRLENPVKDTALSEDSFVGFVNSKVSM